MKHRIRIRHRWSDLLRLQAPRLVIDGRPAACGASGRIRNVTFQKISDRLALRRRTLGVILALGTVIATVGTALLVYITLSVPWWLDLLRRLPQWAAIGLSMAAGAAIGLTVACFVHTITTRCLRGMTLEAIQVVAAGQCLFCDYDFTGIDHAERCPECGMSRDPWPDEPDLHSPTHPDSE